MLYVVRHGESTWNAARRTQGHTMHPRLTDRGRAQASSASAIIAADLVLHGRLITRVVTSDLVRARETAEIIGGSLGLMPIVDRRLREQALGTLEGLSYDASHDGAQGVDLTDPDACIGGGESLREVYARMTKAIEDWRGNTVVVSHGDAIRIALGGLKGHAPQDIPWVDVPSAAVFRVLDDGSAERLLPSAEQDCQQSQHRVDLDQRAEDLT